MAVTVSTENFKHTWLPRKISDQPSLGAKKIVKMF